MTVRIGVGMSESFDAVEAFSAAAEEAARGLDGHCDLCLLFAGAPHLGHSKWILSAVHETLSPDHLIGCGAGGVVGAGREIEEGPGAVVWAASMPEATIETHHLRVEREDDGLAMLGVPGPEVDAEAMLVFSDPYTFSTEALLLALNETRPGMPVLGGLASAAVAGSASLFRGGDVVNEGAVACSLAGVPIVPCVSQGATPIGPEMTITAATENVIEELASRPALERLRDAIGSLDAREQELAAAGLMLGIVIDENQPDYGRGDFLVRPILGADPEAGTLAVGDHVRIGQTVRMHVRDGASALDATLGIPAAGFFCAGEIGPVGGRNFLHGFTATLAVFPAE
jgi:small ligand-binding sensory domain FIST